MPKVQANYSNTIIYKICCKDKTITDMYVGHTTNFIQRKNHHKNHCNDTTVSSYVYEFIRQHGGWDNWNMIQIEERNCKNKREAESTEHYWIEKLNSTLNTNKPYAMCKEEPQLYKHYWYEEKKDYILEKAKHHYEENKEQKLEYQKQYAEKNKEQIVEYQKEYREQNKQKLAEQKKVYREEHKEESKIKQKEWRELHKEQIKKQKAEVIECECGKNYTFGNKSRHLKSNEHISYIDNLTKIPHTEEELKSIEIEQKLADDAKLDKIKKQQKEYREIHKEEIQNHKNQHYETHKEEILEQQKKYVEENKDKIKAKKDEWYQKNKEKILQKQKEMIICECGSEICKSGKSMHYKTSKHQDYLSKLSLPSPSPLPL